MSDLHFAEGVVTVHVLDRLHSDTHADTHPLGEEDVEMLLQLDWNLGYPLHDDSRNDIWLQR